MNLPEVEKSETIDRGASSERAAARSVAVTRPGGAPSARLRNTLDELQQVMENAVASAVESDFDAAIGQATRTLGSIRGETSVAEGAERGNEADSAAGAESGAKTSSDEGAHEGVARASDVAGDGGQGQRAAAALFDFGGRLGAGTEPGLLSRVLAGFGAHTKRYLGLGVRARSRSGVAPVVRSVARAKAETRKARRGAWGVPASIVVGALILTTFLGFILGLRSSGNKSGRNELTAGTVYDADPREMADTQVLTVMVRPQQTLQDLSMIYVGHFDEELLQEIRTLNPELRDPNHIEAGQLIRMPLPKGTLKKVIDTGEMSGAGEPKGLLTRVARWFGGNQD